MNEPTITDPGAGWYRARFRKYGARLGFIDGINAANGYMAEALHELGVDDATIRAAVTVSERYFSTVPYTPPPPPRERVLASCE